MKRMDPIVKHYEWGMYDMAHPYVQTDGKKVAELWWKSTFLLKLLFVAQPLSVQVHPSQEQLKQYPFPDPLPKPEIVIALRDGFQALCGFLDLQQLEQRIASIHCLHPYTHFQSLFSLQQFAVDDLLKEMKQYAMTHVDGVDDETKHSCRIFLDLWKLYPHDPTILAPFYMNIVCLQKGEALIIPAQQPHCYLAGQGMECMPLSDNVVRCGLTKKECQRDMFFEMCCPPQKPIIQTYPYSHEELDAYFQIQRSPTTCPKGSIVLFLGVGAWIIEEENIKIQECAETWVVVPTATALS